MSRSLVSALAVAMLAAVIPAQGHVRVNQASGARSALHSSAAVAPPLRELMGRDRSGLGSAGALQIDPMVLASLFAPKLPVTTAPSALGLFTGGGGGAITSACNPVTLSFDRDPPVYPAGEPACIFARGVAGTVILILWDTDPGPTLIPGLGLVHIGFSPAFFAELQVVPPGPDGFIECGTFPCPAVSGGKVYVQAISINPVTLELCLSNPITATITRDCGSPDLGAASSFGALQLGDGTVSITLGGVAGDVGVGPNGGFKISGSSFVTGTLSLSPGDTFSQSGSSTVGKLVQNVDLSKPIADALAASAKDAALPCTQSFSTWNATLTVTGVVGMNVLCVGNVDLQAGEVITLTGPIGAQFTVNVPGTFKMSGGALIRAVNGVAQTDVVYNITGTGGAISLSGGSAVDGTFLAPKRSVTLSVGITHGQVIAGGDITISSGAQVVCPCR